MKLNRVVVARSGAAGLEYLVNRQNRLGWEQTGESAVQFENVREATRMAMRLPGRLRAVALPAHSAA